MLILWKKSYDQPRQHIKKRRHYFAISSSHICMCELEYKESWVPKNGCFWTAVLKKTLESPLECKEIQPVHPKGNQSWIFIGRTEGETPILWPPDAKNWFIGKDPDAKKDWSRRRRGWQDEMVGWHHQLIGPEFEQTLIVKDRETGTLKSIGVAKSWTQLSNWTELIEIPRTA